MAPNKHSISNELVLEAHLSFFNARCEEKLLELGTTPSKERIKILSTAALGDSSKGPYLAKLCAFVKFLIHNPQHDESLILFYCYLPEGVTTCQAKAMSHFCYSKCGKKGSPLFDAKVSKHVAHCHMLLCFIMLTLFC